MQRRDSFKLGMSIAGAVGTRVGFCSTAAPALHTKQTSGALDAASEAQIRATEDLQTERIQQVKYGSTLEADLIESRAQSLEAKQN